MQKVLGIIFAEARFAKLNELTNVRPLGALPFDGRYRMIDFVLSNMVNSGMINIAVVTQSNYHSLMGHLGSGKQWNLARKRYGLTLFPPFSNLSSSDVTSDSKLEILYGLLGYLKRSTQDYVLLSDSNIVSNMTFNKMFESHIANKADITVAVRKSELCQDDEDHVFVKVDNDLNVTEMVFSQEKNKYKYSYFGYIVIGRQYLIELLERSKSHGDVGFLNNVITKNIQSSKVKAFEIEGYAQKILDINKYYKTSLELLNPEIKKELFDKETVIFTREKDTTPTIYKDNAKVNNSIIADGCVIDGEVVNSILFRGVKVKKGAVIKNSIIMENGEIGNNVDIDGVIADKNVIIRDNKKLTGTEDFPVVVPKGKVI